jgi:replicative DNA helicase
MTLSDPDLETAVLGSWLAYPDQSGPVIAAACKPDHFTGHNVRVFAAMLRMFADGMAIGFLPLAGMLKDGGEFDKIGGGVRLNELTAAAVPPVLVAELFPQLRELNARRRLHALLTDELPKASHRAEPLGDTLGRLLLGIEAISADKAQRVHPTTRELVMEAVKRIESRMSGSEDAMGVPTGISRLDAATGGLRRGSQWCVAGPPKGGKSSLALGFLRQMAVTRGFRCAFFGMEMPSLENVERLLCAEGNASATHLRDGMLGDHDFQAIARGAAKVAAAPIHFRDDVFDLAELVGSIRQLVTVHPDLFGVVVDYAQIVTTGSRGDTREQEVASISRALRTVGLQLNLCVILLSQVNDDGRLRESRALGMDATKIIFIEWADDPGVRTLRLVQRDGPSDKFDVAYLGDRFRFADLAEERERPANNNKPQKRTYHTNE